MGGLPLAEELFEIQGQELRAVVRDDLGPGFGELLAGWLQHQLGIGFPSWLPESPGGRPSANPGCCTGSRRFNRALRAPDRATRQPWSEHFLLLAGHSRSSWPRERHLEVSSDKAKILLFLADDAT